ncbi:MAG: hypothetical protein ACLRX5_05670 [Slackia sp.]
MRRERKTGSAIGGRFYCSVSRSSAAAASPNGASAFLGPDRQRDAHVLAGNRVRREPGVSNPFFESATGLALLVVAAGMQVVGILLVKRTLEIEV